MYKTYQNNRYVFHFNRSMLAYIMIPVMQRELDEFRLTVWNTHRIRAQKETLMADGIPDYIFAFPERYGMEKKGFSFISSIRVRNMNIRSGHLSKL